MKKHLSLTLLSLLPLSLSFAKLPSVKEIVVHLNNPMQKGGTISTVEGGVITGNKLRVQAKNLSYTKKKTPDGTVSKIVAEGELLIKYRGRFYVGSRFEYDTIAKQGVLYKGITGIEAFIIGADRFLFSADSVKIDELYMTTSPSERPDWKAKAKKALVTDNQIKATDISFQVNQLPLMWFPTYTYQIKQTDSPIRYKMTWNSGQGPMASVRYRIFSNNLSNLYARLEYRLKRGFGTALESEYASPDENRTFKSRNFYARDTFYNDNNPNKIQNRYRIQGIYEGASQDDCSDILIRWDRLSDRTMQTDFVSKDFELNTLERTEALFQNRSDPLISSFYLRPRINSYQGFKQELPSLHLNFKPFVLGASEIVSENTVKSSFLDYVYSKELKGLVANFHSARVEANGDFFRPFNVNIFTLLPSIGYRGIFYSNNPQDEPAWQAVLEYRFKAHTSLAKHYHYCTHLIEPYLDFTGITRPTSSLDDHFIFGIQDGLNKIDQIKVGLRNDYYVDCITDRPRYAVDLYLIGFIGADTFNALFPKLYADIYMNGPTFSLTSNLAWNAEVQAFDHANFAWKWTINEGMAISAEFMHRGKYEWRKDDPNNYILDVTRTIPELLDSPLSDNRNLFLTKLQMKLSPLTYCQFQLHSGWGRSGNQKGYVESKFDLYTTISTCWKVRLSYMKTVRTHQFTAGVSLVPQK